MNLSPTLPGISRLSIGGALLFLTVSIQTSAALNTPQILASATTQNCINWRVSGVCYWLFCSMFGCKVRTSVKVTHSIPEAVVSTYVSPGGNPWQEVAFLSQAAGSIENTITNGWAGISAGGANPADIKIPGQRHSAIRFKYADAIGHPATTVIGGSISGYSCNTAASPLVPYFLSTLDTIAWRSGVPESLYPEAMLPGLREIGSQVAGNMWGNIYPRSGFVSQTDDDKASALVAQRVADIITRTGQPHVYQLLKGNRKDGYWPPDAVKENTGQQNHQWQRLAPHLSRNCAVFPDGSHTVASNNNAAFALWRPYSCCQRRGQTFLGSTDIK
jgi:integrating conjugative element protein (TIGR03756 family)